MRPWEGDLPIGLAGPSAEEAVILAGRSRRTRRHRRQAAALAALVVAALASFLPSVGGEGDKNVNVTSETSCVGLNGSRRDQSDGGWRRIPTASIGADLNAVVDFVDRRH